MKARPQFDDDKRKERASGLKQMPLHVDGDGKEGKIAILAGII